VRVAVRAAPPEFRVHQLLQEGRILDLFSIRGRISDKGVNVIFDKHATTNPARATLPKLKESLFADQAELIPRGRNLLPPPKHQLSLDRFVGSRSTPLQGGPHPLLISDYTQRDLANNAHFVSSHWRVRLPSPQGGGRTHAGPFYAILCPRTSSVGTAKIAVAPGPCPQSFRPFGHLLWYLFARGSHSPRATASAPPVLGDMDARA